eukprot:11105-Heterococcus_DN1.PRE.1
MNGDSCPSLASASGAADQMHLSPVKDCSSIARSSSATHVVAVRLTEAAGQTAFHLVKDCSPSHAVTARKSETACETLLNLVKNLASITRSNSAPI